MRIRVVEQSQGGLWVSLAPKIKYFPNSAVVECVNRLQLF